MTTTERTQAQGALRGVQVLDFGQYIPGPLLGMLLSDQGADVIKVERPGDRRVMLISLNWLRSFVALPADLDPHALAERLTLTCAEVEGVEHINVGAVGLICARVESVSEIPDTSSLRRVQLNAGTAGTVETVSAAPVARSSRSRLPPGRSPRGLAPETPGSDTTSTTCRPTAAQ